MTDLESCVRRKVKLFHTRVAEIDPSLRNDALQLAQAVAQIYARIGADLLIELKQTKLSLERQAAGASKFCVAVFQNPDVYAEAYAHFKERLEADHSADVIPFSAIAKPTKPPSD